MNRRNKHVFLQSSFKRIGVIASLVLAITCVAAQQVTYYQHVAPVIQRNCLMCHTGKESPVDLGTYQYCKERAKLIKFVTQKGQMPPWKADPSFRSFHNERILTANELQLIQDWVEQGCPEGEKIKALTDDKCDEKGITAKPDMVIKLPVKHIIKPDNQDEFVIYAVKVDLPEDKEIVGTEVIPGNKKCVHHIAVEMDTTERFKDIAKRGAPLLLNEIEVLDPPLMEFPGCYAPGTTQFILPEGFGVKMPKHCYVLFRMHYAPSVLKEVDQSEIHIYFNKSDTSLRRMNCAVHSMITALREKHYILKNTFDTITIKTPELEDDISILSIQPHMHLLGKSFKIIAVTPSSDTIPMVYVNNWDFYWQTNYFFTNLQKVPAGSYFIAEVVYDNTPLNYRNPFSPPKDVLLSGGMRSLDEMCEFFVYQTPYLTGDEKRKLYK